VLAAPTTGRPLIRDTLSHYRITAALGADGMREVYRATDDDRTVDRAVCAAPLTLVPARRAGPSQPFFARMVLQGVTFQVESPHGSSINRVTVRAEAPDARFRF
jgi:hypothetical protein